MALASRGRRCSGRLDTARPIGFSRYNVGNVQSSERKLIVKTLPVLILVLMFSSAGAVNEEPFPPTPDVITSPMGDGGVDSQQENSGYGSGTGTVPTGASTLPTVEMLTSVSPQVDPSSQSHAAVVTGTAAATISSTPFVNVSDSPRVHSLTTGAIVGIVFGVVFALAMLLALLVFVLRRNGNSGRYIGYRMTNLANRNFEESEEAITHRNDGFGSWRQYDDI